MSTEKESLTTPHASPSSEQHPQDELNTLTYPEGGTQAWLIVAGSFVAMFCTFGYISTFGYLSAPTPKNPSLWHIY